MNLQQLRQLVVLAETLNFRRAAELLHISQPPLTVSIRKLEEELGSRLFERDRRVTLTEAGRAAIVHAREALAAADALGEAVRAVASGTQGCLRVGFVASATYALLPAAAPRFREQFPAIELKLKETTTVEAMRALGEDELDLAIVRSPILDAHGAAVEPLTKEDFIVITPPDHPFARREEVGIAELRDDRFIMYDRERAPGLRSLAMLCCEGAGFVPAIVEEAVHLHTILALVQSGIGIALVPATTRHAARGRVGCARLAPQDMPAVLGFAIATRPREPRAAVAAFAEVLRQAAARIDSQVVSE